MSGKVSREAYSERRGRHGTGNASNCHVQIGLGCIHTQPGMPGQACKAYPLCEPDGLGIMIASYPGQYDHTMSIRSLLFDGTAAFSRR